MTALTERFLREFTEKDDLDDAVFLVHGAKLLQTAFGRSGLQLRCEKWKPKQCSTCLL